MKTWQDHIDTLIEWSHDPSQLEDDGIDAPAPETIARAIWFAVAFQARGVGSVIGVITPPVRVVPSPDGEIVFESEFGDSMYAHRVQADGRVEGLHFFGGRLASSVRFESVQSFLSCI